MGYSTSQTGVINALTSKPTLGGVADFKDSLTISAIGKTDYLRAGASGDNVPTAPAATSSKFQVAVDFKGCDDKLCTNTAAGNQQNGYNQITTGGDFYNGTTTNVLLRTQFLGPSEFPAANAANNGCGAPKLVNQGVDAQPEGTGVQTTAPTTTMLIVVSKDYLKNNGISARSANSFNICVGASWIGSTPAPVNGWVGHDVNGRSYTTHADASGVYWAFANVCTRSPGNDPCVALMTKQTADVTAYMKTVDPTWTAAKTATLMRDSDLAFVVREKSPWDQKGAIYS